MILSKEERRTLEVSMHKVRQVVAQCNQQGLAGIANFLYPVGRNLRALLQDAEEAQPMSGSPDEISVQPSAEDYVLPKPKRRVIRKPRSQDVAAATIAKFKADAAQG